MDIKKLEFYCEGQDEFINYGDDCLILDLGELTQTIAFFPDYILSHIEEKMISIKGIVMAHPMLKPSDDNYIRTYINCMKFINSFYDSILEEISCLNNDIYSNLLFTFPIAKELVELHNHYKIPFAFEKTRKGAKEEWKELLTSFKSAPLFTIFNLIFSSSKHPSQQEITFNYLEIICDCLFGKTSFTYVPSPEDIGQYYRAIEQYVGKIINCCHEIATLKQFASSYITTNADFAELSKDYKWIENEKMVSKNKSTVPSIKSMLLSEIAHLKANNYTFKECELCGKFFVTNRPSTRYCDKQNSEYNYITCQEVGIKRDKESDPVYQHLNKLSKVYSNWKKNQPKRLPGLFKSNMADAIKEEMDQIYNNWRNKAYSVLIDYQHGKIELDFAVKSIALPEIEDRSPLLAKLKYDFKHQ